MTDLTSDSDSQPSTLSVAGYAQQLAGTYTSGWAGQKNAAASSLRWAGIALEALLNRLADISQKTNSRAEASFIINNSYDASVSGPALAAILFPAFALEGFVRLGYQVGLELKRPKGKRALGYDDVIAAKLDQFEAPPLSKRIDALARVLGISTITAGDKRRREVDGLVAFRNATVHESPTLITSQAQFLRRGNRRTTNAVAFGGYLDLANNLRPARLKHAIRAVRAHDEVVAHFFSEANREWVQAIERLDSRSRGFSGIRRMYGRGAEWASLKQVSGHWESAGEKAAECSIEEHEDFVANLKRRVNVRLVT